MIRERATRAVLVLVGLLFTTTAYPLVAMGLDQTLQMMLSIYVTLGIFLLLAAWDPPGHRSLIAFAAWSSLAHAAVMAVQSIHDVGERVHLLVGVTGFALIGMALIALAPKKASPIVS